MKRKGRNEELQKKFSIKMQKKLVVLFVIVLAAFAALNVRLMKISKEDGDKYKKQVLSQQQYDSITLPAKRGDIVDRKGTKIAVSEKVYNIVIDTKAMTAEEGKYQKIELHQNFRSRPEVLESINEVFYQIMIRNHFIFIHACFMPLFLRVKLIHF